MSRATTATRGKESRRGQSRSPTPFKHLHNLGEELYEGFEKAVEHIENGLDATHGIYKFMKKRAEIEAEYAQRLAKLCEKGTSHGKSMFKVYNLPQLSGTLGKCWSALHTEAERQAVLHKTFSEVLSHDCCEPMQAFIDEEEEQKKHIISEAVNKTKEYSETLQNLDKTHESYEKAVREAKTVENQRARHRENNQKLSNKVATAMERADQEYRSSVMRANAVQNNFFSQDMPRVMEGLEKIERSRLEVTSTMLASYIEKMKEFPAYWNDAVENMKKGMSGVKKDEDLQLLVELVKRASSSKPRPFSYTPHTEDREDKKEATPVPQQTLPPPPTTPQKHGAAAEGTDSRPRKMRRSTEYQTVVSELQRRQGACTPSKIANRSSPHQAIALYDFEDKGTGFSFRACERIDVETRDTDTGWWLGVDAKGTRGWFPAQYVRLSGADTPAIPESTIPRTVPLFGSKLEDLMAQEQLTDPSLSVPRILSTLIKIIKDLDGLSTEGIFRIPGGNGEMTTLKAALEGGDFQARAQSVHTAASLLKQWLRDLQEPLIPHSMYQSALDAGGDTQKVMELIHALPEHNRAVVRQVVTFLRELARPFNVAKTKMGPENLAVCFAPGFLRNMAEDLQLVVKNNEMEKNFVTSLIEMDVAL